MKRVLFLADRNILVGPDRPDGSPLGQTHQLNPEANTFEPVRGCKFEGLTTEFFTCAGFDLELGPGRDDGSIDVRIWPKMGKGKGRAPAGHFGPEQEPVLPMSAPFDAASHAEERPADLSERLVAIPAAGNLTAAARRTWSGLRALAVLVDTDWWHGDRIIPRAPGAGVRG